MICPNCKAEIPEGSLYCSICGEEITIVPVFDPQVEDTCQETITQLTKDLWKEETNAGAEAADASTLDKNNTHKHHSLLHIFMVLVVLLFLLAAGTIGYFVIYHSQSQTLTRADASFESGDYEQATALYEALFRENPNNPDIMFRLAECYRMDGEEILYENLLLQMIKLPDITEDQYLHAYRELVSIYESFGDYESIKELIKESSSADIKEYFSYYLGETPQFLLEEGVYDLPQLLVIQTVPGAAIYYTLDGSIPSTDSSLYSQPIFLDDGSYTISAYVVTDIGISGEIITKNYTISSRSLPNPDILPYSGSISVPTVMEIQDYQEGVNIYYTTDGSKPSEQSNLFAENMLIPLGASSYRFISMDAEGKSSDVVEREYNFRFNSDIDISKAKENLIAYLSNFGRYTDEEGVVHYWEGTCEYSCRFAVYTENFENPVYLFTEQMKDSSGNISYNNLYGVDPYLGDVYSLYVSDGLYYIQDQAQ